MTKFGTFYFIFIITLYFYSFSSPFSFWFTSFISIIVFPILIFLNARIQQHLFYGEFLRFLSVVILAMQRGQSFSTALEVSLRGNFWKQDLLLRRIFENVVFSQQEPVVKMGLFGGFIKEVHLELSAVYCNQHQAIDRLCNFKKKLQDRLIFRQKSRQIWMYFGYQLGLLSLIYFGLMVFIGTEYGFTTFRNTFFLSFLFYLLGILVTTLLAKGKKWHI